MERELTFYCNGCSSYCNFKKDFIFHMINHITGEEIRLCKSCRKPKATVHDVYFDGRPEENLADDPRTGKPRIFSSKAEKAAYLKSRDLVEGGDRVHGAPYDPLKAPKPRPNSLHETRMALKYVREMGRDVRHQEFLKLKHEAQKAQEARR
jgi:hypothetical protein